MSKSLALPNNQFRTPGTPSESDPESLRLYTTADPSWSGKLTRIPTNSRALPIVFHKEQTDLGPASGIPSWRLPTNYFGKPGTALRLPRVSCSILDPAFTVDDVAAQIGEDRLDAGHVHLMGGIVRHGLSGIGSTETFGMPANGTVQLITIHPSDPVDYYKGFIDEGAWIGGEFFLSGLTEIEDLETLDHAAEQWRKGFRNFQRVKIVLTAARGRLSDLDAIAAATALIDAIKNLGIPEITMLEGTIFDTSDPTGQEGFDFHTGTIVPMIREFFDI